MLTYINRFAQHIIEAAATALTDAKAYVAVTGIVTVTVHSLLRLDANKMSPEEFQEDLDSVKDVAMESNDILPPGVLEEFWAHFPASERPAPKTP